jgi:hypothetical protein
MLQTLKKITGKDTTKKTLKKNKKGRCHPPPVQKAKRLVFAFRHRYMIMGGWETSLFPRDPSWRAVESPAENQA